LFLAGDKGEPVASEGVFRRFLEFLLCRTLRTVGRRIGVAGSPFGLGYPQLYSRVGFVHEFRPLSQADVRQLLREGWLPSGISLPDEQLIDEEAIATLIRIAEGKFRLLHRLLTQIARVQEINRLDKVSREVVEAARENLVIGRV
jgi:hypothetical protein